MDYNYYEQFMEIAKLYKKSDELYHRIAVKLGISDACFWTLYSICESTEPLTQNEIAGNVGYPQQTINSAIKNLEKSGFIYLEKKAVARNSKTVHLTKDGQKFCDEHILPVIKVSEKCFDVFSEEEIILYLELSNKVEVAMLEELNNYIEKL